ncbi:MAG: hypothetical protein FWG40_00010 [Peptococcaceae bacterium]|nr:hypothetical protein [Peptococcaceae bacterium]
MGLWFVSKVLTAKSKLEDKVEKVIKDETGEVNIVAIVMLIFVVIAVVAIFREQLIGIINTLFEKIREAME